MIPRKQFSLVHHYVLNYKLNIGSGWLDWKYADTKLFSILVNLARAGLRIHHELVVPLFSLLTIVRIIDLLSLVIVSVHLEPSKALPKYFKLIPNV